MSFSSKIRWYLILAVVLPPLIILFFGYFFGVKQVDSAYYKKATSSLEKYEKFDNSYKLELQKSARRLIDTDLIARTVLLLQANRAGQIDLAGKPTGFDFTEILDKSLIVRASTKRADLIGNKIHETIEYNDKQGDLFYQTVEIESQQPHAAIACLVEINSEYLLYCGWYITDQYLSMISDMMDAELTLYYNSSEITDLPNPELMNLMTLYEHENRLYALLKGGPSQSYYLTAEYSGDPNRAPLSNILILTATVAGLSIILAVLLGFFITGKSKKEMANLIEATEKISQGDFDTTIMAYDEGEFAQLSDAFSDMVGNLKNLQYKLTTAEKIAAWKIVGQKVAHEIKNPLTPILISLDDLRTTFYDDREEFDRIFKDNTDTIKTEITRMTRMLNEFVSFARMNLPEIGRVDLNAWIEKIKSLYKSDIESGRLQINYRAVGETINIDEESMKRVLINLIKNGLEATNDNKVFLTLSDTSEHYELLVEDNGPGFDQSILENAFTPYYTTKEKGSGLGLAICQRIVFDHGGTIELSNLEAGGAQVKINLPK